MLRLQAFKFEFLPQWRTTPQPAAVRWVVPLCLQQSPRLEHRTLREKGKAFRLRRSMRLATKLENGTRVSVRCTSASIAAIVKNLERAYTNFFRKRADFPKFKKKGQRESFRIPQGFEIDNQNGRIKLPKLGWMRYRKSQDILGEASNLTVSESCGKWYVSFKRSERSRRHSTHQHQRSAWTGA